MVRVLHDCTHHGHVWLETDGTPYTRHRGRNHATVSVTCTHCHATATLKTHGAFTASKGPHTIDSTIPAPFMKVVDRALINAGKKPADSGPAQ